MKAEELRIGNHILYNDKVISISPVGLNEFYYLGDTHADSKTDRRSYKPIPLSEEWLLKLGFKSVGKLHPTFKIKHYLIEENLLREGKYYLRQIINKTDSLAIGIELRYVHQLQNLYFALTGEELNIKP